MINVLMIGPSRKVHGGISAVVNNLFEAGLDKVVNLKYVGTMEEGNKLHKLLVAIKAYLAFAKELAWADVVHVNVASDSSYLRKSLFIKKAHKTGKKIIIHQHGGDFEGYYSSLSDKKKQSVYNILSMGDAFLVLSPAYKTFFEATVGLSDVRVLPDTIPVESKVTKSFSSHKLLFLGRICEAKGVKELLISVKKLSSIYPDIHLYLGGIYEVSSLKDLVASDAEHVTYLGWLSGSEKSKWLDECAYFILPSYFEGQSVSILEAMAHSCAIVASNVGGIPMMISDQVNGLLVEPRNVDSLYDGLSYLFDHPELAQRYSEKAYETVKQDFSIENTVKNLLDLYEKVCR